MFKICLYLQKLILVILLGNIDTGGEEEWVRQHEPPTPPDILKMTTAQASDNCWVPGMPQGSRCVVYIPLARGAFLEKIEKFSHSVCKKNPLPINNTKSLVNSHFSLLHLDLFLVVCVCRGGCYMLKCLILHQDEHKATIATAQRGWGHIRL